MEKKFKVAIVSKAVHTDYYEVTANNPDEALEKAGRGDCKFINSHTDFDELNVDYQIVDNYNHNSLKVGDRVLFTIDRKVFVDVITYIDNETIEGEKYDLTTQKLTLI